MNVAGLGRHVPPLPLPQLKSAVDPLVNWRESTIFQKSPSFPRGTTRMHKSPKILSIGVSELQRVELSASCKPWNTI